MLIQLPNDAKAEGYKEVKPYHFEQVFSSKSANFTGTESEFVLAGKAYAYANKDKFTRSVLAGA